MIPIHINKESKFKTVTIALKFKAPLDENTLTERALLAKLLTKSTAQYPTEQQLYDHLSELYGAHLSSYVTKQNTASVITVSIEFINDKFIDENLFDQACQLLSDVINHPDTTGQVFNAGKVEREKQLLASRFDHVRDNKAQASFQQMLQEMFKGQSYRFSSMGIEEHLSEVTPESVYAVYRNMLENDEKALYIIGDINENLRASLDTYFNFEQSKIQLEPLKIKAAANPEYITEHTDTSQARINIGMTVPIKFGSADYFAFIVLNQIYGGDAASLLFMNVREKMSLAYQIHSQADARLGLMYVIAGVQNKTYKKTVDVILRQLELIRQADFPDELLSIAKKMLISHRRENLDRPRGWIEMSYASTFDDVKLSTEEWMAGIAAVTKEDVAGVAQSVNVQTIYCLANEVKA